MNRRAAIGVMGLITMWAASAEATTYRFHVGCSDRAFVAEWNTGAIDPGKEYLRVVTGTKNPSCTITDYNDSRDAGLPREEFSGAGGVVAGLPPVAIICGIFGC